MKYFSIIIYGLFGIALGLPQKSPGGRITGGHDVDIAEYPYALQLHYLDRLECGGVLLTMRLALTAAHCLFDKTTEYFVVRAGTTNLAEGGQAFTIPEVTFHPQFNYSHDHYDVAVFLLSDTVSVATANVALLATDDSPIKEGAKIIIAGWGWLEQNNNDEDSPTLQAADLTILDDQSCRDSYDTPVINDEMFCANYSGTDIVDFCYGDYGGPGVMDGIVQGIISFGEGCGDGHNAKVFVRVSKVVSWIQSVIDSYN